MSALDPNISAVIRSTLSEIEGLNVSGVGLCRLHRRGAGVRFLFHQVVLHSVILCHIHNGRAVDGSGPQDDRFMSTACSAQIFYVAGSKPYGVALERLC